MLLVNFAILSVHKAQVSVHVPSTNQTPKHHTLKSHIHMVGPFARLS